jgi:hypothetical protein
MHVQENPLSLLGQYNDDDGDENNTPLVMNGTMVLSLNNANILEHVNEHLFSCLLPTKSSWFVIYK